MRRPTHRLNRRGVGLRVGSTTPITPANFGTLVAWIDPRYNITHTGDGTAVTAWTDHGPNAYAGTIIASPTYEATGWNGHPSVLFNGTDNAAAFDGVATFASGTDQPTYIVMAVQLVTVTTGDVFVGFGRSTANTIFHVLGQLSSNRYQILRRDDALTQVTAASAVNDLVTTPTRLTWEFSGTTTTVYKNGTVTGINAASLDNGATTLNRFAIGAQRGGSASFNWANVRFGPVLVYSSLTDRAGAEAWLTSEGYA